jgi:hypothetical protein
MTLEYGREPKAGIWSAPLFMATANLLMALMLGGRIAYRVSDNGVYLLTGVLWLPTLGVGLAATYQLLSTWRRQTARTRWFTAILTVSYYAMFLVWILALDSSDP